ncbi:MAG: SPOR domain-containing protein [Prevotella sp.]
MNKKKLVTFSVIALCSVVSVEAQTYMDHLRQTKNGKAGVTVTQSKAIDELVNGGNKGASVTTPGTRPASGNVGASGKTSANAVVAKTPAERMEAARKEAEDKRLAEAKAREDAKEEKSDDDMDITSVDMRKKVMRGSRKVLGYRVQAFAGGNTRNDKQTAQQIGNAIKIKFPDQPVYVHFYSPRWICRVGNFRSYQEAQHVLKQIRAMGYQSATIVKGQITVQY